MSALRFLIRLSIVLSLSATPLLAQGGDLNAPAPAPAAEGTPCDLAIGYSYVNMNLAGRPSINLNGVETSGLIDFRPSWGAILDASWVRAGRDPGSGHSSYVLSVLTGPVFIPARNKKTRLLVRALAGVSLVDGSVQVNQLYFRGWLSRFSWAIGTGIERKLSPFAVRFNVDYLGTRFVSPAAAVQAQNGIRLSGSVVFRVGARPTRHIPFGQP
jgi:hypothetical protein